MILVGGQVYKLCHLSQEVTNGKQQPCCLQARTKLYHAPCMWDFSTEATFAGCHSRSHQSLMWISAEIKSRFVKLKLTALPLSDGCCDS